MTDTNKKKHHFLFNLIPIAAIAVIVVMGVLALHDILQYRAADEGYDDLLSEAITVPESASSFVPEDDASDTAGAEDTAFEAETSDEADTAADKDSQARNADAAGKMKVGVPGKDYPAMKIDYADLRSVNKDFVGVLSIPVLELVYPIAHSHDNTEYLSTTFYGTHNPSGCIFLDRYSSADYEDRNTFILGHNMRNMSMFGSLKRFEADASLCDTNPYFYIYNEDCIRRYRIFSYYEPSVNDKLYDLSTDYEDNTVYDNFIQSALSRSHYRTSDTFDFSARPRIVTLSTCWATDHTNNLVVHGYLDGEFAPPE